MKTSGFGNFLGIWMFAKVCVTMNVNEIEMQFQIKKHSVKSKLLRKNILHLKNHQFCK